MPNWFRKNATVSKVASKKLAVSISLLLLSLFLLSCGGSGGNGDPDSDEDPPKLSSVDPTANNSSVPVGSVITTTFDKEMNSGTLSTFVVYGSLSGKLTGTYTGGGSETLIFNPDKRYKIGEVIEITLTSNLTSTKGVALDAPIVYLFWAEALPGTGSFSVPTTISGQIGARALAAGDWDSDGDIDLATGNFGSNSVDILNNDGSGSFTDVQTIVSQDGARALAAGDWDGDGDLDLAAGNFSANRVDILKNDSLGTFTVVGNVADQRGVRGLAAGDWDGDGDLDLAAANFGSNRVDILENNGAGNFTQGQTIGSQFGA
ncbi:MAG: Ig-like domain-containing protein, partial [Deltaproteobacteria bacterium]|nr:Ig-like domain-containing protein [Deltaproteobacteria bacterium]